MFWRFGFHACSAIDTLLDKPDVTLEEILGEDDLLQECKAHNTKLIEYLRDPNILSKLLNYIIADEQVDDKAKFKYSYVSCEVLSCEIWSICETVVQNRDLLLNFWKFLDRPTPLNPLQASYFTKVNEQFLEKKTDEMIPFIKSIPHIVPKLLRHIETSAIMDLLLKIISMEKSEPGSGIVEWLHDEGLIPALLAQMNPHVEPDIQGTVADVLKAIIAISANSSDPGVIGPNALSRELVSEGTVSKILDYMLDPDAPFSTASLTNGVSLIIELIRKNNSDYDIEPILAYTLESHPPTSRDPISLGTMLRLFASRIHDFQRLLAEPKSVPPTILTTFGEIEPLGFERFRICELYAELLHCSNMTLLNDERGEEAVRQRDMERESLKKENLSNPKRVDIWGDTAPRNGAHQILTDDSSDESHNEDERTVPELSYDGEEENLSVFKSQSVTGQDKLALTDQLEPRVHAQVSEKETSRSSDFTKETSTSAAMDTLSQFKAEEKLGPSHNDNHEGIPPHLDDSSPRAKKPPVVGDFLKMQFVEARVLPCIVDLFFAHPWNNFLHNVVYDILTQVLNGPMDRGYNRQLALDLFTTGQLIEKIVRGQRASDEAQNKEKGVRLGYMGHLTLVAEEVLKLAERTPWELLDPVVVAQLTAPEWNAYVDVTLTATRTRDNAILGGVRPQPSSVPSHLAASGLGSAASDLEHVDENAVLAAIVNRGIRYENGDSHRLEDEFEDDREEREAQDEPFVRYMSQNLANDLPDRFASSDEDEDDEEVVGWMGETGEFEPATSQGEDEGGDEEVNVMREFGRRGLFQERWDSEFPDDDEYEFRNAQPSPPMEGHDDPGFNEVENEDNTGLLDTDDRELSKYAPADIAEAMETLKLGLEAHDATHLSGQTEESYGQAKPGDGQSRSHGFQPSLETSEHVDGTTASSLTE